MGTCTIDNDRIDVETVLFDIDIFDADSDMPCV